MSEPNPVVRQPRDTLQEEPGLTTLLERSLVRARERAEADLDGKLFAALEWPTDIA